MMVGAEMEHAISGGVGGELRQKRGLENAVLVVAEFWPRVGKEDENLRDSRLGWQGLEKQPGFGVNEVRVRELGTVTLLLGAFDAVNLHIDAQAELLRMRRSIGGEKVAVAAADFPRDVGVTAGKDVCEAGLNGGTSRGEQRRVPVDRGDLIHGHRAEVIDRTERRKHLEGNR